MSTISQSLLLVPHCLALPIYSASFLSPHSFALLLQLILLKSHYVISFFMVLPVMFSQPGLLFHLFSLSSFKPSTDVTSCKRLILFPHLHLHRVHVHCASPTVLHPFLYSLVPNQLGVSLWCFQGLSPYVVVNAQEPLSLCVCDVFVWCV